MSGNNHNMNHIVKRIETRVLAPPGGFSSISFGGAPATGDIYRGHDFNPKTNNQMTRFPKDSTSGGHAKQPGSRHRIEHGRKQGPQLQERDANQLNNVQVNIRRAKDLRDQRGKENKLRSQVNRERRDSLDELIAAPQHPQKQSSCTELPTYCAKAGSERCRRQDQQQSLAKSDYAEALRQQIATKKRLSGEELQSRPYQQRDDPQQNTCNRRSQFGSGAGRSSISLSWD